MEVSATGVQDEKGESLGDAIFTPAPFSSGEDGAPPAPTRSGGGPFSSSHGAAEQEDA